MKRFILFFMLILLSVKAFAQPPVNDNCNNSSNIPIGNLGFQLGTFNSDTINIANATMQAGESVTPSIYVAALNQKSIWYKFKVGTNRQLRVSLKQVGAGITAGDVGFSVYKTNLCLPNNQNISTKITPIAGFGSSFHNCVDSGEYLIQVTSKLATVGQVFVELQIAPTFATYDERDSAYQFGVLNTPQKSIIYSIDYCHSKESANETCLGGPINLNDYSKTTWHTFTTPAFFDYITMLVASGNNQYFTTGNNNHIIGYKLYKGNARTTALSALTLVDGCDTLQTTGYIPAYRTYSCGELDLNSTYSLQLFFKSDFEASIRVGFFKEGVAATKAPKAISSQMNNDNKLGILSIGATTRTDYFSCTSRHANNACGSTKTAAGIVRNGVQYNLSSYFTFELANSGNVQISTPTPIGTTNCQSRYVRVFSGDVTNACATLNVSALYDEFLSSKMLYCLPSGKYTVQVLGSNERSNIFYNDINNSNSSACFYSNFGQKFELSVNVSNTFMINNYALNTAGAIDSINQMQPLVYGSSYSSLIDTFGCSNTVLPANSVCDTSYTKAMYREFKVADSGLIRVTNMSANFTSSNNITQNYKYMLFKGDAKALAQSQNTWGYPAQFTGLTPYSTCFNFNANPQICITPATYTFTTFGTQEFITKSDKPIFNFRKVTTHHYNQATVENMGDIIALSGTSPMTSSNDTFSCLNNAITINGFLPCTINHTKAIYRQFYLSQLAIVQIARNYSGSLALFKGQLSATGFNGLTNIWPCFTNRTSNYCQPLEQGWYTVVSYGTGSSYDDPFPNGVVNGGDVGKANSITITIMIPPVTTHHSPATTENMGSIIDTINNPMGGYVLSSIDFFSCIDNAITIDGKAPCNNATKAIYREYYLTQPGFVQILNLNNHQTALFAGRLSTVNFAGLTSVWTCFTGKSNASCEYMPVGWYTVVSYGKGYSYLNPPPTPSSPNQDVGQPDQIGVYISVDCQGPQFNRPYKAAIDTVTNAPFLVEWNAAADTGAYPVTRRDYTLPTEYFNCTIDTPFSTHPISGCDPAYNRVAYYVFKLTQESYLNFTTGNNYFASIYKADVRTDSLLFANSSALQPCMKNAGRIEICKAQPGTYTLVIFSNSKCASVSPKIHIDKVGTSRFDHAKKAYDFGIVPADNSYYNGKVGDVNPLQASRAASNDFFYCTTGAQISDPDAGACNSAYNPNIYNNPSINNVLYPNNTTSTDIARRNLWYTFQVDKAGWVTVKADNKTPGRMDQLRFVVFKSDVNGNLTFNQIVSSGLVDSTLNQGLVEVAANFTGTSNVCAAVNSASFFIPPCNFTKERYYVLVENRNPSNGAAYNNMRPNHQVEISIKIDSTSLPPTIYDYYSAAGNIGTIGVGHTFGPEDNFTCATASPPYPITMPACAQKTIWYKFTVANNVAGVLRIGLWLDSLAVNNTTVSNQTRLFQEILAGDSTSNGLREIPTTDILDSARIWQESCISQGTYYLLLTGCNMQNQRVYPELAIEEVPGDYCTAPQIATVSGAGTTTSTVIINCHTIGTDYGEFSPTLTCPVNGVTNDYKTSWFRIDITGTDTLDLTAILINNTTASSTQIQYRMMSGNCNAMQEQSCVMDVQTQNTYQCLLPGSSYYIQVFVPKYYIANNPDFPTTGSISLSVDATQHVDTCAPYNDCIANANFLPEFDCTVNDSATFVNYSTYGNVIDYLWDFGYNNQTSTLTTPSFRYPALSTTATYTVTLRVVNTGCHDTSFSIQTITIPPRPEVNLGNDTVICTNGATLLLNATSHPGSTYLWQNNSTTPTQLISNSGNNHAHVAVSYAGCTVTDSINVYINPVVKQPIDTLYICSIQDTVQLNSQTNVPGVSYLWNNNATTSSINVNNPGLYWSNINLNGCTVRDSFYVILRNANYASLGNDTSVCALSSGYVLNASAPGVTSYLWSNNTTNPQLTVNSPGLFWVNVIIDGCMYSDSINIVAHPLIVKNVIDTICYGVNYLLPSNTLVNTTGIYQSNFTTINGCDSAVITNLFVRNLVNVQFYDTICSTQLPYIWNGVSLNAGGMNASSLTVSNIFGCDSTTVLNLTVYQTLSSTLSDSVCVNDLPYTFAGHVFTQSGIAYDTFLNANNCDSIVQVILTAFPVYSDTLVTSICAGDTFMFNNTAYTQSGNFQNLFQSQFNCDSSVLLSLTVNPLKLKTVQDTICFGANYTLPSNQIVSLAGIYYDTLSVVNSCDSVVITNLFVRDFVKVEFYDTVCSNQMPFVWNGISVTVGGTNASLFVVPNIYGCDSTTVLNLTVHQTTSSILADSICQNQLPFTLAGHVFTQSGIAYDTFVNAKGCDSVRQVILTVFPVYLDTLYASACIGDSFIFNNNTYTQSGNYLNLFQSQYNCDSSVLLSLLIKPMPSLTVHDTICYGTTYTLPSNQIVGLPGIYNDTLTVPNNCDSVVITHLFIRDSVSVSFYDTICSNQLPYIWNGLLVNTGGTNAAAFISPNIYGCDSMTRLNLVVNPVSALTYSDSICASDLPYIFMGTSLTTSGTYSNTVLNVFGCDSVVVLNLEVLPVYQDTFTQAICDGDSFLYNSIHYATSGVYPHHFLTLSGCDSNVVLALIVHPIPLAPGIAPDSIVYCVGTPASQLTATGSNLKWYSQASGGAGTFTAPTPTTFVPGIQKYYVTQTVNGCESPRAVITIIVEDKPIISFTAQPDLVCQGEETLVTFTSNLPLGFLLHWDWEEGSSVESVPNPFSITWTTFGQKKIKLWIANPTCVSDTAVQIVNVMERPEMPIINLPDYACVGDSVILSGSYSESNLSFYWEGVDVPNNQPSYDLSWNTPGMKYFSLYTYNNVCVSPTAKDSIWISDYPLAKIVTDFTEICQNDTLILKSKEALEGSSYYWSPEYYFPNGFPNNKEKVAAVVIKPGYFYLDVTNKYGCKSSDSLYISTVHCCLLFVPNAFSPNNDGLNDKFELKGEASQTINKFIIYNRYGQAVFTTNHQNISWDGTYDGKIADPGVYFYQLRYTCSNGKETFKKGEIHLIR